MIVNDIRNFVFGLAEATVYGSCKSRKQKFVMSFTILAPPCLSPTQIPIKSAVQVSDAHMQTSCMARVRSAQRVRRAVAIGILFILVSHAGIDGTNDT